MFNLKLSGKLPNMRSFYKKCEPTVDAIGSRVIVVRINSRH